MVAKNTHLSFNEATDRRSWRFIHPRQFFVVAFVEHMRAHILKTWWPLCMRVESEFHGSYVNARHLEQVVSVSALPPFRTLSATNCLGVALFTTVFSACPRAWLPPIVVSACVYNVTRRTECFLLSSVFFKRRGYWGHLCCKKSVISLVS